MWKEFSGRIEAVIQDRKQAGQNIDWILKNNVLLLVAMNKAVAEMEKVIQQTAAISEESAASAQEMNAQAEGMKDVVRLLTDMVRGKGGAEATSKNVMSGMDVHLLGSSPKELMGS